MRKFLVAACLLATLLTGLAIGREAAPAAPAFHPPAAAEEGLSVYFSPRGGCEAAVVALINAARTTIDVQAFSFTNKDIAQALVNAKNRNVKIRIVLDESNQTDRYTAATFVHRQGIRTWIDSEHAIAHNKIMIIDAKTIITGSFNFTNAAEERNAENLLIIQNKPKIAAAYRNNFENHLEHSKPYVPPEDNGGAPERR